MRKQYLSTLARTVTLSSRLARLRVQRATCLAFGLFFSLLAPAVRAQFILRGTVSDGPVALPGASLQLAGTYQATTTDYAGHFALRHLSTGTCTLVVSYLGYETATISLHLRGDTTLAIGLVRRPVLADEVVITATNATQRSAVAYTNLTAAQLAPQNLGQDLPLLLNFTPSAVTTSDAGAGVGYTGLRIRGSDATRVNVTLNGIPYNDVESQGTFFVNLPDFASSVSGVQVQRGVGTSTNGAAAFGASVNIQTNQLHLKPYAELNNSFGSFNTWKHTVRAGTGLLHNQFTFDARLSKISSDGYVDRAFADLRAFYLSGGYYGKNTTLRLNVFSGRNQTYQAWNGVPQALLANNRRYNAFTYPNQTDNYQQDHYQLFFSQELGPHWQLNAAAFYTRGRGYYEEYKADQPLADYGLAPVVIRDSTIARTNLIRRLWLDNHFFGNTFSVNYDGRGRLTAHLGGGWNRYLGQHYGEVIWAQWASNAPPGHRFYDNDATKTDLNLYGKVFYQLTKSLNAFADGQVRRIGYAFVGRDRDGRDVQQTARFTFFNPKLGLTYVFNDRSRAYASYGVGNKEPNRADFTESSVASRPLPERLQNVEVGYVRKARQVSFSANAYWMDYRDQLVLTGQINDVGGYPRQNVPRSYRVGLELELAVTLAKQLRWQGNATLSQNKIRQFRAFVDNYDTGGQQATDYTQTDLAFSPNAIAASELAYAPTPQLTLTLLTKYVGKQYLDNTRNEGRRLNPYLTNDLRATYVCQPRWAKELTFSLLVNNVLGELYESNGYTFSYVAGGQLTTENFYFPQAGRHFLLGVGLKF